VALRHIAPPGHQELKPMLELPQHLRRGQDLRPGARQLQGQGNALQGRAKVRHGPRVRPRHLEVGSRCLRPVHEELHAVAAHQPLGRAFPARRRQGRHEGLGLARQVQRLARRDQAGHGGRTLKERPHGHRPILDEVLEVVQDQQRRLPGEHLDRLVQGLHLGQPRQA